MEIHGHSLLYGEKVKVYSPSGYRNGVLENCPTTDEDAGMKYLHLAVWAIPAAHRLEMEPEMNLIENLLVSMNYSLVEETHYESASDISGCCGYIVIQQCCITTMLYYITM